MTRSSTPSRAPGRHADLTLPGRARAKRLDAGKRHPSLAGYSPRHAA